MSPLIRFLTTSLLLLFSSILWAAPTATIAYGNGVWTDEPAVTRSILELQMQLAITPGLPEWEIVWAQNKTDGRIADLYEAFKQDLQSDVSTFLRILAGISPMPDIFLNRMQELSAAFDSRTISNFDLTNQVALYKQKISVEGKKVVLVAHSQGNYFGNQAYSFLSPEEKHSFGIVAVATPASAVADGGPWVTSFVDFIIDFLILRPNPLPPLPPNTLNGITLNDLSGHLFVQSYLRAGSNSRPKILDHIVAVISSLDVPPGGGVGPTDFDLYAINTNTDELVKLIVPPSPGQEGGTGEVGVVEQVVIGPTGFDGLSGLAYDSRTDRLLSVDNITDQLVSLDRTDGSATVIGPIIAPPFTSEVRDLAFGPNDTLYALIGLNSIAIIDPTTAEVSILLPPTSAFGYRGLAYQPNLGKLFVNEIRFGGGALTEIDLSTGNALTSVTPAQTPNGRLTAALDSNKVLGIDVAFNRLLLESIDPLVSFSDEVLGILFGGAGNFDEYITGLTSVPSGESTSLVK